jgi:hypothetical protein
MSTIDHRNTYLNDLLGRLDDVVDDLAELSLLGLDHEELDTVLTRTCGLVSQAQGLEFAAIQEAEASGLSARFGNRVLTTHLAKTTHQPVRAIGSDRAMAIWLNDLPQLHSALTRGVLSRSHVTELKAIDSHRVHTFMIRDQNLLVEAAHNFAWTEWKQIVAYWLNAADPDGELTDPTDPKYGMRVRSKTNGDVAVSILMDPLTGEAFLTMHDAEVKKLERNEREQLNDDPNAPVTSQTQKGLHALLRLMVRGWRREDGSYPDFLVNIVMSEKLAENLLARIFGHINPDGSNPLDIDPFELPIAWSDIDGRCETIRGTPYRTSFEPAFRPQGAKTLTRFPIASVYAQRGRLGRAGSAARGATTSTTADVDRKCRRVNVSTVARHRSRGSKPTTSSRTRNKVQPTSTTALCAAAPTTKPKATASGGSRR